MRVDVPTLRCDRCDVETQDINAMAAYQMIEHYHMSGRDKWDVCPRCWSAFLAFLDGAS